MSSEAPSSAFFQSPGAAYPLNPHDLDLSSLPGGGERNSNNAAASSTKNVPITTILQNAAAAELFQSFDDQHAPLRSSKISTETMREANRLMTNEWGEEVRSDENSFIDRFFFLGGGKRSRGGFKPLSPAAEQFAMAVDSLFLKLWASSIHYNINVYSSGAVTDAFADLITPRGNGAGGDYFDDNEAFNPRSSNAFRRLFLGPFASSQATFTSLSAQYLRYVSGTPSLEVRRMNAIHRKLLANCSSKNNNSKTRKNQQQADSSTASSSSSHHLDHATAEVRALIFDRDKNPDGEDDLYPADMYDGRNKKQLNRKGAEQRKEGGGWEGDDAVISMDGTLGASAQDRESILASALSASASAFGSMRGGGVSNKVTSSLSSSSSSSSPAHSGSILYTIPARDRYLLLISKAKRARDADIRRAAGVGEDEANKNKTKIGIDGMPEHLKPENRMKAGHGYTDPFQEIVSYFRQKGKIFVGWPTMEKLSAAVDRTVAQEFADIFGFQSSSEALNENLSEQRWTFLKLYSKLAENLRAEFEDYLPAALALPKKDVISTQNKPSSAPAVNKSDSNNVQDDDDELDDGRAIALINSIGKDYFNGMRFGFVVLVGVLLIARRRLLRDEQRKAFLFCQRMCEREVRQALMKSSAATIAANATSVAVAAESVMIQQKETRRQREIEADLLKKKRAASTAASSSASSSAADNDHILTEPPADDPYYINDCDEFRNSSASSSSATTNARFVEDEDDIIEGNGDAEKEKKRRNKRLDVSAAIEAASQSVIAEKQRIREVLVMSRQGNNTDDNKKNSEVKREEETRGSQSSSLVATNSKKKSVFYRKMLIHHAHWMFAVADPNPRQSSRAAKTYAKFLALTSATGPQLLLNANTGFMLSQGAMNTATTHALIQDYTKQQVEVSKRLADEGLSVSLPTLLGHGGKGEDQKMLSGSKVEGENAATTTTKLAASSPTESAAGTSSSSSSQQQPNEYRSASSALAIRLGEHGQALLDPSMEKASSSASSPSPAIVPPIPLPIVQQQMLLMLLYSTPLSVSEKTVVVADVNDGVLFGADTNIKGAQKKGNEDEEDGGADVDDKHLLNPNKAAPFLLFGENMSIVGQHGGDSRPLSTRAQEHLAEFLTTTCKQCVVIEDTVNNNSNQNIVKNVVITAAAAADKKNSNVADEKEGERLVSISKAVAESFSPRELKTSRSAHNSIVYGITLASQGLRRTIYKVRQTVLFYIALSTSSGNTRAQLKSNQLFLMSSVLWHRVLRRAKMITYDTSIKRLDTEEEEQIVGGARANSVTREVSNKKGDRKSVFSSEKTFYYKKRQGLFLSATDVFVGPVVNKVKHIFGRVFGAAKFIASPILATMKKKDGSPMFTNLYGQKVIKEEDYETFVEDDFYSKARQQHARIQTERGNQRRLAAEIVAETLKKQQNENQKQKQQQQLLSNATDDSKKKAATTPPTLLLTNEKEKTSLQNIDSTTSLPFYQRIQASRIVQLVQLQLRYGYFSLTIRDRLQWKLLILHVARRGVPKAEDVSEEKKKGEQKGDDSQNKKKKTHKSNPSSNEYVGRPFMGIPYSLLLAQIFIPLFCLLTLAKAAIAHQRYHEIIEDQASLLELFKEATRIAEAFEESQHAQRLLIERSPLHYDLDEVVKISKAIQIQRGLDLVKEKARKNQDEKDGENEGSLPSALSSSTAIVNPLQAAGKIGGGNPFTSSSFFIFKTNAVNPPAAIPTIGFAIPNDYHTEALVSKLDPSAVFTAKMSEKAKAKIASLPVINSSQMTLLSKSQQVEMLQYALKGGASGGGGVGAAAMGATINIDTHRFLSPDFDVDSTSDFVVKDVVLNFRDGFLTAFLTVPSIVEVAQPKFAPSWIVVGVMQSLFSHV